jgi:hypothetical protein
MTCILNWGLSLFCPNRATTSLVCNSLRASMHCSLLSSSLWLLPASLKSSMNFYTEVPLRYLDWLAAKNSFILDATSSFRFLTPSDRPVLMIPISMMPVMGSVAANSVAFCSRQMAASTSSSVTYRDSLILAKASLILMRDSSWRGVADMFLLPRPMALILR